VSTESCESFVFVSEREKEKEAVPCHDHNQPPMTRTQAPSTHTSLQQSGPDEHASLVCAQSLSIKASGTSVCCSLVSFLGPAAFGGEE
jgi:hypothetical protein